MFFDVVGSSIVAGCYGSVLAIGWKAKICDEIKAYSRIYMARYSEARRELSRMKLLTRLLSRGLVSRQLEPSCLTWRARGEPSYLLFEFPLSKGLLLLWRSSRFVCICLSDLYAKEPLSNGLFRDAMRACSRSYRCEHAVVKLVSCLLAMIHCNNVVVMWLLIGRRR